MAARMLVAVFAVVMLVVLPVSAQAEMKDRVETKYIVVHHSATDTGNVETFRRHHKEVNGWDDVGYHYVITNGNGGPDGEVQTGRAIEKIGAHAKGRNADSVGVCLVATDKFTKAQLDSLVALLVKLCRQYKIDPTAVTIQRHHEKCPGPGLDLGDIIARVKAKL